MKVLVTGGSGVVGQAAVDALVSRDHAVRLLSRGASEDAGQWPAGVEPWPGSVTDPASVKGSAAGCDVVLHLAGIIAEEPPERTFARVNVQGTREMVWEAERSKCPRFIYVSSLGADRGESPYHRSKHAAEEITRGFTDSWTVLRPGNVYGPGDEVISLLLKLVRSLPVVPVIDDGDQEFQPMWVGDLALALAMTVERNDLRRKSLELAGPERVTLNRVLDELSGITGRRPPRVPVPGFLASIGSRVAQAIGLDLHVDPGQITMLREGNVLPPGAPNALITEFGIEPTSLSRGLRMLADATPELLVEDGVGALKRKRFWVDIVGSNRSSAELFELIRMRFGKIMPIDLGIEPGTDPNPALDVGATLTMQLPLRGNIQVRCERIDENALTLVTLEGHPLAGAVRFMVETPGEGMLRFEIQVYDRAANLVDFVAMRTVGDLLQNANWEETVRRVVELSGGAPLGDVERDVRTLEDEEAAEVERWIRETVRARKRDASPLPPS